MSEDYYFAADAEDAQELHRLRHLERQLDPMTKAAFAELGLRSGDKVLEVGPGAGSMLNHIAEAVGPQGHVTGLDMAPRFLKNIDAPNITVQTGNILDASIDGGPFDFVYARFVLLHIPQVDEALARLFSLLRPGGRMLFVDLDFEPFGAVDPHDPRTGEFNALIDRYVTVLRERNVMELYFGRGLPVLLERAGCVDVRGTGAVWSESGDTDNARFWRDSAVTTAALVQKLEPERTDLDVQGALDAYDDPAFRFQTPTFMIASGRRPL
ncbi:MAG: methyltransferase domain-containing protein [Pseudomonadota bacterium]